ncbi:hypothetical protein WDH52_23625, partial [Streptomyces sp. TRM70308]
MTTSPNRKLNGLATSSTCTALLRLVVMPPAASTRARADWSMSKCWYQTSRLREAVGQDWAGADLDAGLLTVAKEIVVGEDGWTRVETEPKTDGSAGTIGLDSATVGVLSGHRVRQLAERKEALKAGKPWADTGKVFTDAAGEWLHPETVSETFRRIYRAADLPPINAHGDFQSIGCGFESHTAYRLRT